jgi:exopolysaccharide production protein ExoY
MYHKVVGFSKLKDAHKGGVIHSRLVIPAKLPVSREVRWIDSPNVKRTIDIVGAALILLFFLPLFAIVAALISLRHGGPVIFGHKRVGRDGVPFSCLKFRTMHTDADRVLADCLKADPARRREWAETRKLKCDPRVLGIGGLLRKSSLDELPQLINVLRGEMSLVGPRPIVREEAINYGCDFASYLAVRPGITGLWQVSGRNNTTYAQRVALDVRYVRDRSMMGDCRILLRTVRVVLTGHGAY